MNIPENSNAAVVEDYREIPRCPIFGQCGGCQYQDRNYSEELRLKENYLRDLFQKEISSENLEVFTPIVPSPRQYQYRCVLDLKLLRTRSGEVFVGFSPLGQNRIVPADGCPIAMNSISEFFPELRRQAIAKLTPKYRVANLVVKTGDDGRVFWGGIGKRSLDLKEQDYLWTEIKGKRIFYSLNTFFQANLSILPGLIQQMEDLKVFDQETVFYDLYGGVGFFGILFAEKLKKVILVEENRYAIKLARYNQQFHGVANWEIIDARVEDQGVTLALGEKEVVMIDPPRAGLSLKVLSLFCAKQRPQALLYLSCQPESLIRDIRYLVDHGWQITKIIPFDFFPRTRHLETLVVLFPATV